MTGHEDADEGSSQVRVEQGHASSGMGGKPEDPKARQETGQDMTYRDTQRYPPLGLGTYDGVHGVPCVLYRVASAGRGMSVQLGTTQTPVSSTTARRPRHGSKDGRVHTCNIF